MKIFILGIIATAVLTASAIFTFQLHGKDAAATGMLIGIVMAPITVGIDLLNDKRKRERGDW